MLKLSLLEMAKIMTLLSLFSFPGGNLPKRNPIVLMKMKKLIMMILMLMMMMISQQISLDNHDGEG